MAVSRETAVAKPRHEMTMGDFIHSEVSGPKMKKSLSKEELADQRRASRAKVHRNPFDEEEDDAAEEREREGSVALAPKVKVVDGKLVVDQDSLTVTTGQSSKDPLVYTSP